MLTLFSQGSTNSTDAANEPETVVRDIHALTPQPEVDRFRPLLPPPPLRGYFSPARSVSLSDASENFTTISREFNALVIAGSSMENNSSDSNTHNNNNDHNELSMIREEVETNALAIVPDGYREVEGGSGQGWPAGTDMAVQRVKREEVEAKIAAWQNVKVAKINNRFKREDAIINGWENEQIHKANSWMKKIEFSWQLYEHLNKQITTKY